MSLRATSKYEIICYSLYLNIGMPTSKTFLTVFLNWLCMWNKLEGCSEMQLSNSTGLIGRACQWTNMWPMELHYFSVLMYIYYKLL